MVAPVYTCGYTDQLDACGADGCVAVPAGPGLGVRYDWDFIRQNAVATRVYA
jgi:L-alanine-DL-glutamate epimerase-like enolase superfamily enzyme